MRSLAAKARRPDPERYAVPTVAAVCVYPDLVGTAVHALAGTDIGVASVATAFPSGRAARTVKIADVDFAVAAGATEVDMVIDRTAFLRGRYGAVFDEIVAVRAACGAARLKVILATGELATYDNVHRASWLALLAGADFVKTSTGKVTPAATLPVTHVMLQAVRDWYQHTGLRRGVKPAGGIRDTKDAIRYLVTAHEVAGSAWLDPRLFRFGASSLLNAANPVAGPYFSFTVPEPTGVVGVIAPQSSSLPGLVSVLAPVLAAGNTAVVVASAERPLPAVTLGEVLATSDVPAGVANILTGRPSELAPWLAGHGDVNAIDLVGAAPEQRVELERAAADTVQRVLPVQSPEPDWTRPPDIHRLRTFTEAKTVWHPSGT